MTELLVLIETYQVWIYVGLALVGLVYLRATWRWGLELRKAVYGLERERAVSGLRRSIAMLVLVGALVISAFVAATFISPSIPFASRPTELPTVSLLASRSPQAGLAEPAVSPTEIPLGTADASGCTNPNATLTSPEPGETLSGIVEIEGTADIENFAFYLYEFRPVNTSEVWQAISAGTTSVIEGQLGTWDTSLVPASDYAFRLVVTDSAGNAPLPCEIHIRIVPPEG
jgi:hypothetical protein